MAPTTSTTGFLRRIRGVIPNAAILLITLLLVEIMLHVATGLSRPLDQMLTPDWKRAEPLLPDPMLGYRGNPLRQDHDANGYRNRTVAHHADIVTLGDSHTYGVSVERDAAWPAVVSARTGLRVYDMSLSGYGPAHSLLQIDRALALEPRVVVVGLYFGNDFYDAFALSKINAQIAALLPPDLAEQSTAAERQGLLAEQLDVLFRIGPQARNQSEQNAPEHSFIRRQLAEYSKLYALVRAVANSLTAPDGLPPLLQKDFARAVASLSAEDLEICSVHDDGTWRTILTAPYRLRALDVGDPRISAGVTIALRALEHIQDQLAGSGAALLVVLLPTKESVFAPRVSDHRKHVGFESLSQAESALRERVKRLLSDRGIAFVDPLQALRAAERQPYFEDADGHPNEHGHDLIALEVVGAVNQLLAPGARR